MKRPFEFNMENKKSWEATEEVSDNEEFVVCKSWSSNNHIAQLTERCSQLVGNNTLLEQQVNLLLWC